MELFPLKSRGPIYFYLKFLNSKKFEKINGDIVEAGVFKGSSLISSALILKSKKAFKNKKYGVMILLQVFQNTLKKMILSNLEII